ncbi:MAG: substrate-binding domain-containing protein [Microbacteriaceae bacterium]
MIGSDDIPEPEHLTTPLTTIGQDFAELGRTVMFTLLELILDGILEEAQHPVPHIVVRETAAAVRP